LPRVVDRFTVAARPDPATYPTLPPRLVRLVAGELAAGFALETLLRHPEARRAGDRPTLVAALAALQRGGVIVRHRTFLEPRIATERERMLEATGLAAAGPRVRALVALVAEAGTLRRGDAALAGFSAANVARAIKLGALREERRDVVRARPEARAPDLGPTPTPAQRVAIDELARRMAGGSFSETLLQGVTGSGKTLVYLHAIAAVLAAGGRAIVLVPEIALTPQTARRFVAAFGERVAVLHSALSERERFESWAAAARGDVDVVVGARGAIFAPLPDVRLVVIDEAHERTYKQEGAPRYDALAVARERMRLAGGALVLGSATPPLEAAAAARAGNIGWLRLDARAAAGALPAVRVVDLAAEFEAGNRRPFSATLVEALGERLARGEKSVLFVNRRGSGSFVLCRACGAVPDCARCSISLAPHRAEGLLRCHLCDAQRPLVERCAACGDGPVREFGIGTERVAELVAELYPGARIVRMDSDTTTHAGDHARLLDEFEARGDVLIGTQMIAKGLDYPTVTLAAVVAADIGLHAPEFRAAERTFDLIVQVAGRSGRAGPGEAIVQTYDPSHPAIAFAARHDVDGFAEHELGARRELGYPPAAELTYIAVIGRDAAQTEAAARRYAELARRDLPGVEVLGPAPFAIARANDEWRWRIACRTARAGPRLRRWLRETLRPLAARERGTRLAIDVDP